MMVLFILLVKMVVHNVKVYWGFRFLIPDKEYYPFINSLYAEKDDHKDIDSDNDNGSDLIDAKLIEWCALIGSKCKFNYVGCFHSEEGMVRYIDIGFPVGDFNISGKLEKKECRINSKKMMKYIKYMDLQKKVFKTLPIWKYNVSGEALLYGLPDDCLYCS
jgi:hypothetical protein